MVQTVQNESGYPPTQEMCSRISKIVFQKKKAVKFWGEANLGMYYFFI